MTNAVREALMEALRCFKYLEEFDTLPSDTCPADLVDIIERALKEV